MPLGERHCVAVLRVGFPSCVRASLHFFNTQDEMGALAEAVRLLAETGGDG